MADSENLPEGNRSKDVEIVPPSQPIGRQHPINSANSTVSPAVKFIGFTFLFNALLWLLALFVQIRGWVDVTASYIVLLFMWLIGTLICLAIAFQSRVIHKKTAIIFGSAVWAAALVGLNAVAPKPHKEPRPTPIAPIVFLGCQITDLPVTIPPHSALNILPVHTTWPGGFQEAINSSDKPIRWPNKNEATPNGKLDAFNVWKCDISNHGSALVMDLAVVFEFGFGQNRADRGLPLYNKKISVVINPLDPRGPQFTFWVVNQCDLMVITELPKTATVQLEGESSKREIQLRPLRRNGVEVFMQFFPSAFRWAGVQPCDLTGPH